MRRSGMTSRAKCASFSISHTSCSSAGPRGPAVWMFTLSVTGAPEACVRNGRLVSSFMGNSWFVLLRTQFIVPTPPRGSARRNAFAFLILLRLTAPPCALVEDRPDEIEAGSCRQQRGDAGWIVGRRDFDEIHADDVEAPCYLTQQILGFVVGEATMAD